MANLLAASQDATRVPLPHDGSVLAILVRVHIIGGSVDVAEHLKEVHLRPDVVLSLIEELIHRGFPGYEHYRLSDVKRRLQELYTPLTLSSSPRRCVRRSSGLLHHGTVAGRSLGTRTRRPQNHRLRKLRRRSLRPAHKRSSPKGIRTRESM